MIILKIIAGILLLAVVYILFLIICSLMVDTKKEYDHCSKFYFRLLISATACAVVLLRIRLKVTGKEKLPEGRFLLVSNHRSNFDPILSWYVFRSNNLAFVSKPENFKIPCFGRIIRKCAFMAIDREDPRASMKTLMKAAELMKANEASVGIYPEGTRNKEPQKGLLPFHNGVFKTAQMAGVPIVVMTIQGTEKIHVNYPFHATRVKIDIVDVISPEEQKALRTGNIGERVAASMNMVLQDNDK